MFKRLIRWLHKTCANVTQILHDSWHRLLHQPGYAEAAADILTYAVRLCCRNWLVIGLVNEVAHGVAAMIRDLIRSRDRDDSLPWQLA